MEVLRTLSVLRKPPVKKRSAPDNGWKTFLPGLFIIVAVVAAFWPAFSANFIWDDDTVLTENLLMRAPLHLLWFSKAPFDYFPVTYSSLWLESRLWGANPLGYHVVNVLLHACSCVILWRVLARLKFPAPWLAALLFAVHPVNVESVAWIAERKNVLAMFFFMLTAWSFVRFAQTRQRWFYIISIVSFILSLLSKPAAVGWPLLALGVLWLLDEARVSGESQQVSPQSQFLKKGLQWVAPFVIASIVLSVVNLWFQTHRAIGSETISHRDLLSRITMAGWIPWFYLYKAVWPVGLSFVYRPWTLNPHGLVAFLPGLALIAGAVVLVLWFRRRAWTQPALIALMFFLVMLAPVLGFADIYFFRYSYVADHWQYFALPAVTTLVVFFLSKVKFHKIIGVALVILFAGMAFARSRVYHDNETLWTDTLKKNPQCWLACNILGMLRYQQHRPQEAADFYQRSLAINPDQAEAHNYLSTVLLDTGHVDEARAQLDIAAKINPDYPSTYANLGSVYHHQGDMAAAIAAYRKAIAIKSDYFQAFNNLGVLLSLQGMKNEAIDCFVKSLTISPDNADALINLGGTLNDVGRPREALPALAKALALKPNSADGHLNLGTTLFALDDARSAFEQFAAALKLNPSIFRSHYGLGNCYLKFGQLDDAEKMFQAELDADPDHAESHYQLAVVLMAKKEKQRALEHLREAIRLKPDWINAINNFAWAVATDEASGPADRVEAIRCAEHAVQLTSGSDASSLDTLAAAWARNEVFSKATEIGQQALNVAINTHQTNLVSAIEKRVALYSKRLAYYEP